MAIIWIIFFEKCWYNPAVSPWTEHKMITSPSCGSYVRKDTGGGGNSVIFTNSLVSQWESIKSTGNSTRTTGKWVLITLADTHMTMSWTDDGGLPIYPLEGFWAQTEASVFADVGLSLEHLGKSLFSNAVQSLTWFMFASGTKKKQKISLRPLQAMMKCNDTILAKIVWIIHT